MVECEQQLKTISQKEAEVVSCRKESSSLSKELANTQSQFTELKRQLDKQKDELQSRIEKLQQDNTKLTKRSEQSEQEQKRIEQVYKEAQEKIKELEAKLSSVGSQQIIESNLYDVILVSPGKQKLAVVKIVKETLHIGLKETVELVDKVPGAVIQNGLIYSKALLLKSELEEMGAIVELHPANSQSKRIDNSSTLNRHQITSSDEVISIVNSCKKTKYASCDLYSDDSVTDKLDLEKLVKLLAVYGIKASVDEVMYYKTVGKLKSMILKKAGLTHA